MAKDFYRKLKIQEQLTKARLQEPDEFMHREVVDSTCYLLNGYVSNNGEAPSIEKEASMLGYEVTEHLRLFEQNRQQEFEARDDKGRLYSPEVLHELHIRKVRSQAGKASAESRLFEQKDEQNPQQKDQQNPNYNYNYKDGSDSVSVEGEESISKGRGASFAADFEMWWQGWPEKKGKDRAHKHYTHWRNQGHTADELLRSRDRIIAEKAAKKSDVFPNGSTFLNPVPHSDSANISDYLDANYQPPPARSQAQPSQTSRTNKGSRGK